MNRLLQAVGVVLLLVSTASAASPSKPNTSRLEPAALASPGNARVGDGLRLDYAVRNPTALASARGQVTFSLSSATSTAASLQASGAAAPSAVAAGRSYRLTSVSLEGLAAGQTVSGSVVAAVPNMAAGEYNLVAVVHESGHPVTDDRALTSTHVVTVAARTSVLPNLSVVSVSGPTLVATDTTITGTAIFANDPAGSVAAGDFVSEFQLALDGFPEVIAAAEQPTVAGPLSPGAQVQVQAALAVPANATPGTYRILARADVTDTVLESREDDNQTAGAEIQVVVDALPPELHVTAPADGLVLSGTEATVTVSATDDAGVRAVTANGLPLLPNPSGTWSGAVPLLEGPNALVVTATDLVGHETTQEIHVRRDTIAPALELTSPAGGSEVYATSIRLAGRLVDAGPVALQVAGAAVPVAADGSFGVDVPLAMGDNAFTLVAVDQAGNRASAIVHIQRVTPPLRVTVSEPAAAFVVKSALLSVRGVVTGAQGTATVTVNGTQAPLSGDGSFSAMTTVAVGQVSVEVAAADASGQTVRVVIQGTRVGAGTDGAAAGWCDSKPGTAMTYDPAGNLTGIYDTANDVSNCGCPGHACAPSAAGAAACSKGVCGVVAGAGFIGLSNDPTNCGTIGHVCPAVANGGATCENGSCAVECATGYAAIGSGCFDILRDPLNCGSVGNVCQATTMGVPVCTDGLCGLECRPEHVSVGGRCIDINTDPQNCGTVQNVCPGTDNGSGVCVDARCGLQCDPGYVMRGWYSCVDLSTDPENCGAVYNQCPTSDHGTTTCSNGVCNLQCEPHYLQQAGACIDVAVDPANCGGAGVACSVPRNAYPTCTDAVCGFACNPGYVLRGGQCEPRDPTSDLDYCGADAVQCPPDEHGVADCDNGVCGVTCNAGYGLYGGVCVPSTDPAHCGTRTTACPTVAHAVALCINNTCDLRCADGYERSGNTCVAVAADPLNCGWVGHRCTTPAHGTAVCEAGACGVSCNAGYPEQDGACVDVQTDQWNCGALENICPGAYENSATCSAGVCATVGAPSITGVARMRTVFAISYTSSTGLLALQDDLTSNPPSSVIGGDGTTEYQVLSVSPAGLMLARGLDPAVVLTGEEWAEGTWWKARLVFPPSASDTIDLTRNDGLVVRGTGLRADGQLGLMTTAGDVPGDLSSAIYSADKAVVPEIRDITERFAFVAFRSVRGDAATWNPVRWSDAPRITSIRAEGDYDCGADTWACPSYVAYGRQLAVEGYWLDNVNLVSFEHVVSGDNAEELVPARGSGSASPDWYQVTDANHLTLWLDVDGGPVARGLLLRSTYNGSYTTYLQEPYPGLRYLSFIQSDENGLQGFSVALTAVPPSTKAISYGRVLTNRGYRSDWDSFEVGTVSPLDDDRLLFRANAFTAGDVDSIRFVSHWGGTPCPAAVKSFGGSPIVVRFEPMDYFPSAYCRMVVRLKDGSEIYSPFTFWFASKHAPLPPTPDPGDPGPDPDPQPFPMPQPRTPGQGSTNTVIP
ncbi:MAG: hypothetical protein QM767_23865 [Anaeromyxobacter sp.]